MMLGSILIALTIDNLGQIGNIIKNIIGVGCYLGAAFIAKRKGKPAHYPEREKRKSIGK